jgi:hypothetical protein
MEAGERRVDEQLRKTVHVLETADIPYAVIGGHAVRAWVAEFDPAGRRGTRDVDIMLRACDLPPAISAMTTAGFCYRESPRGKMFLERPDARDRDAIDILICAQIEAGRSLEANPDVEPSIRLDGFKTVPLETLVRMKLNAFRTIDRVHLQDMLEMQIVDPTWLGRFPAEFRNRLQELLEDPNG